MLYAYLNSKKLQHNHMEVCEWQVLLHCKIGMLVREA